MVKAFMTRSVHHWATAVWRLLISARPGINQWLTLTGDTDRCDASLGGDADRLAGGAHVAVADETDHRHLGTTELGADDRRGQPPHGAVPAGDQVGARPLEAVSAHTNVTSISE